MLLGQYNTLTVLRKTSVGLYLGDEEGNDVLLPNKYILPEYEINKWSNGALFGISAYPVKFSNGSKLGFYLDAYRGSQIYEDYYNLKSFEMPGSSFIKYGVRYRF